MHPFGIQNPANLSLNVLFPEHFEASKRMIIKDFILLGSWITGAVVALVWIAG